MQKNKKTKKYIDFTKVEDPNAPKDIVRINSAVHDFDSLLVQGPKYSQNR